jgi:hypothetical protein
VSAQQAAQSASIFNAAMKTWNPSLAEECGVDDATISGSGDVAGEAEYTA